jgi:light-regulated signal transduction histidine kinase (bacteriophytochrome)
MTGQELEARLSELEARVQAADQELEALSYAVVHDLRAPLRSIEGFSQALLELHGGELGPEARALLDWIHSGGHRMSLLIEDLSKLGQIPRAPMVPASVDLSKLAQAIAAELRASAPDRQAEFHIAAGLRAHGDRDLLRLALRHLLHNAWKFTGKHPSARIELGKRGAEDHPTFFVRDDGAGFRAEHSPRLFGAFQRFHPAGEFEGRGIGLAIVRRIVNAHGGTIWAESAVERGATFYFTLGAAPEREREATAREREATAREREATARERDAH